MSIIFRHDICGDQETPFECWAVEHFVHIREQGSKENFFPLIGGEVAVAGGQTGGDDEQQADGTEEQSSFCGNINLLVRDDYLAVPDEIHHLMGQPTLSPDDMDIARNLLRDPIRLAHLQQPIDAHKIKRSSKKNFVYKVTCILCSSRYVGVIQVVWTKKSM